MLLADIDWAPLGIQIVSVLVPLALFVLVANRSSRKVITDLIAALTSDVGEIQKDCIAIKKDVAHTVEQGKVHGERIDQLRESNVEHNSACNTERTLNRADIDRTTANCDECQVCQRILEAKESGS